MKLLLGFVGICGEVLILVLIIVIVILVLVVNLWVLVMFRYVLFYGGLWNLDFGSVVGDVYKMCCLVG